MITHSSMAWGAVMMRPVIIDGGRRRRAVGRLDPFDAVRGIRHLHILRCSTLETPSRGRRSRRPAPSRAGRRRRSLTGPARRRFPMGRGHRSRRSARAGSWPDRHATCSSRFRWARPRPRKRPWFKTSRCCSRSRVRLPAPPDSRRRGTAACGEGLGAWGLIVSRPARPYSAPLATKFAQSRPPEFPRFRTRPELSANIAQARPLRSLCSNKTRQYPATGPPPCTCIETGLWVALSSTDRSFP